MTDILSESDADRIVYNNLIKERKIRASIMAKDSRILTDGKNLYRATEYEIVTEEQVTATREENERKNQIIGSVVDLFKGGTKEETQADPAPVQPPAPETPAPVEQPTAPEQPAQAPQFTPEQNQVAPQQITIQ